MQVMVDGRPQLLPEGTPVVVMRSPSYSPGDVRILKMRMLDGLKHIVDAVVFPVNGERPHPDEMSGGDLDGDKFFVCWDPRLVPKSTELEAPQRYDSGPPAKAENRPEGPQREDLIKVSFNPNQLKLAFVHGLFIVLLENTVISGIRSL